MHASGPIGSAVIDPRIVIWVGLAKPTPHHLNSPQRMFLGVVGRVGSTTTSSNAPSSLNGVGAVEWKPYAQWSLPGQHPQPMSSAAFGVFRTGHAIVIGRHHITDQRRTISALGVGSRPSNGAHLKSKPPAFRIRAGFDSDRDIVETGTAWCLPLLLFILPANTERLLVGISAGIGTNR